jgi:hypothetical protein
MKKLIGKVSIVVVLVMVAMMMCGFTWQTEEVPESLINELKEEGFVQDPDEENIWTYEEYVHEDSCWAYVYATFDVDENVGIVTYTEYNEDNICVRSLTACVKWDNSIEDFEQIAYFDRNPY